MHAPEKLLLAAPRGYCAGVDRAVQTVERALELHGAPVYVRKEIVHNKHVVETLRDRGAVFVDELDDTIPEGAITVFSAHGVSPAVHADAERRQLQTIDATCPLVTKVHREAIKFAAEGYTIVLIGHAGHEEVEGTMGEAPDHIVLIESEADVDTLEVEDERKLAYINQTTLSVDETRGDHRPPAREVPAHHGPAHRRHLLRDHQPPGRRPPDGRPVRPRARDRLQELLELEPPRRRRARPRHAVVPDRQRRSDRRRSGSTADTKIVGISSGASVPEELVENLVAFFRERGTEDVQEFEVLREDVRFMLPKQIRQAMTAAAEA